MNVAVLFEPSIRFVVRQCSLRPAFVAVVQCTPSLFALKLILFPYHEIRMI